MSQIRNRIGIFIILLLTSICYLHSFDAPFYFDDFGNIDTANLQMNELTLESITRALTGGRLTSRPLSNLSFALNYYIGEYRVAGYHLFNLLVHLAASVGTFFLFLRLIGKTDFGGKREGWYIAFFSAIIWACHPLGVQSVTYLVQRMNSMAGMFCIFSLLAYVTGRDAVIDKKGPLVTGFSFFLSLFCGILAIASKENAAILPFLVILVEWFFYQKAEFAWIRKRAFLLLGAFLSLAGAGYIYFGDSFISMVFSTCPTREFTALERLYTQPGILLRYLSLVFYPAPERLIFDYYLPFSTSLIAPVSTLFNWITIGSALLFALICARKNRIVTFAVIWFLVSIAIESSFICLELYYEHRTYLPSLMIIFAAVAMIIRYFRNPLIYVPLFCAILFAFCSMTVQRNMLWTDPVAFWQDNISKNPENPRPYINLGRVLDRAGRSLEAEKVLRRIADKLVGMESPYHHKIKTLVLSDLAMVYKNLTDYEQSEINYRQAQEYNILPVSGYLGFAETLYLSGKREKMLKVLKKAAGEYPKSSRLAAKYGEMLLEQDKPEQALEYLKRGLKGTSDHHLLTLIGMAYLQTGNIIEAEKSFLEALAKKEEYIPALYNIGLLYSSKGDIQHAAAMYERVIRLEREKPPVRYNLGNMYFQLGRYHDAIEAYRPIKNDIPLLADTLNNTGMAYVFLKEYDKAARAFAYALRVLPEHRLAGQNLKLCQEELEKTAN